MSFGISVFSSSRTRSGIPLCDVEKAGPRITSGVTKGGWQGQVSGVHSSLSGSDEKIASIHASVTASAVGGSHFGLLSLSTRSEEHTSELHSLMRISYAVFCLKTKTPHT